MWLIPPFMVYLILPTSPLVKGSIFEADVTTLDCRMIMIMVIMMVIKIMKMIAGIEDLQLNSGSKSWWGAVNFLTH